jgi:hypothetical protein
MDEFKRMQQLAGLLTENKLEEDLYGSLKKGVAGAALATSLLTSPSSAKNEPIDEPKETVNYGLSNTTNQVISDIRQQLGLTQPLKNLTTKDLKAAYSKLKDVDIIKALSDIEKTYGKDVIYNMQVELDWILGGNKNDTYGYNLDKNAIDNTFKYLGRLMDKKPIVKTTSDTEIKSYPFGYYK